MFEMDPEMDFGERLSLWWSCFWRQTIMAFVLAPLIAVVMVVFTMLFVASAIRSHHHIPTSAGGMATVSFCVFVVLLFFIPLTGDAVRRGFLAQDLTAPRRINLWGSTMLGLVTFGWSIIGAIPFSIATQPLEKMGHPVWMFAINFVIGIPVAMYLVLPRQARRLRLQCGFDE